MTKRLLLTVCVFTGIAGSGLAQAQEAAVADPNCTYFGPQRERFAPYSNRAAEMTARVTAMLATGAAPASMPTPPGGTRTFGNGSGSTNGANLIDVFIWNAFKAQGVTPAAPTNDYEFIRRATLDLTGRIPTADRVNSFVADTSPTKRAALIEELLASPQWIDRWTMFYGDLFKNASNWASTGTSVGTPGRDGFNSYIRASLTAGTPYNVMASSLIGSAGTNNWTQGELNWQITGRVTGTGIPIQDTWDQETANVAETFLGMSHMNCVLCHDGRGHLDSLSLWGASTTRLQAWGFSSFLSHTNVQDPLSDPTNTNSTRLWYVNDAAYKTDYTLNTTTGNRPPRQPIGTKKTITPAFILTGAGPNSGEGYRQAMARIVTGDMQFARAAVNYVWAFYFGMGIVDPPDQFDPARLDPNNPPPAPWTLQPSNPDLLNALAEDFIASNYDLKHLMRLIANSRAYQLESQYDPTAWNPNWQPLFARHLVRRLWSEEVADSIALSSNIPSTYTTNSVAYPWAMQLPEPAIEPKPFMQAFLPGNRDDQPRRPDGAIQQALVLMNDNSAVMSKLAVSGSGATQSLLSRVLTGTNANLINLLYLNILSRNPTAAETQAANTLLSSGNKTQKAQELMWTLYNKVDFMFNY